MNKPLLREFRELAAADFEEHPLWIGCHTADYDEPWYDQTTEETFRPRTGSLPADPEEGMLLVRAEAMLNDGSQLPAFLTPGTEDGDIGTMQPYVFVEGRAFGFWRTPEAVRQEFRMSIGKNDEQIFPLSVTASSELADGVTSATVSDWLPVTVSKRLKGLFGGA